MPSLLPSLLPPLGHPPIRPPARRADRLVHGFRCFADAGYRSASREIARLRAMPRRRAGSTTLGGGPPIHFADWGSFLPAFEQIFLEECYRFEAADDAPRIVDGGAHVGLASIYWKRRFPGARIVAFEPDPANVAALRANLGGASGVELRCEALWTEATTLRFRADGADGGHLAVAPENAAIDVPTTRLRDCLGEATALLKLDVEGAEAALLADCAGHLESVERVFVEVHSRTDERQQLADILALLREEGFRVHLQPELVSPQPFVEVRSDHGMDQRLNVFAYRPPAAIR